MAETPYGSKSSQPSKTALRPQFLKVRSQISPEARAEYSRVITQKILSLPIIESASQISVYISLKNEVNTKPLIQELLKLGKKISAPVVSNKQIKLRSLTSLESCVVGEKNILEPPSELPFIEPKLVDLFIVPGLSFDSFGYRLGYGKGYYDQLLSQTKGFRIGICFTDQLMYSLPHDIHDVKMNQVISDTIVLNCFPFAKN